jgi:flagellar motor switch protein FliN
MADVSNQPTSEREGWLLRCWVKSLGDVLEAMAAERPEINVLPAPADPAEQLQWWEQPIDFADGAALWAGASDSDVQILGQHVLAVSGVEDASLEDSVSTYRELMQQILGGISSAIGAEAGREVCCVDGAISESSPTEPRFCLEVRQSADVTVRLHCSWTPQLMLATPGVAETDPNHATSLEPVPQEPLGLEPERPDNSRSRTMDLLLDVELPVSVSFGRAHLPLKDVLKLASGSIVELNRSVAQPVEVIVNNCVVARGEVVVVEGNYGVRISEIISRRERLRTLH